MTDNPQAETTLVEGPQTVSHNANELRRKLATAERIRENADFHLGQEMARRQLAEKETAGLRAVVARLRQMTDHWEQQLPEVIRTPAVVSAIRAALEAADGPSRMADGAQQPETQSADRAAIIAEILPAWEAVYEPGNVSDYLIGYANDEAPAKAATEAWMRSQAEVTGRLEWVPDERLATGRYDQWFELIERHADGIDTGPGLIVRRRVADEVQPDPCSGCRYVPCGNCPTAAVSQPGKEA